MKAKFHLPGLFEFYDFYQVFLPIYEKHREFFYEWAEIASIYGAPADCLWGGGRIGEGKAEAKKVLHLLYQYGISARLTFSNSMLTNEHLTDEGCNALCKLFAQKSEIQNGVIVHSDLLLQYLLDNYPNLYLVSSTTKVLTEFSELITELQKEEFQYVVPDFRLNKNYKELTLLKQADKDKLEFLCNECCDIGCKDRKVCYETVSRQILGEDIPDHVCKAPGAKQGYLFSKAMQSTMFISIEDIRQFYLQNGFTNFKIEGRNLGSAILLEFLLYYLVKPEFQLRVRELIYLDSMLDLF